MLARLKKLWALIPSAQAARIRKALTAGGAAFVAAEVTAAMKAGGWPGWPETGAAAGLGLGAAVATWRVPNAPPKTTV